MNKEKAKILLRLFKEDVISSDEFMILMEENPIYMPSTTPNWIQTQPFISTPYYTSGTGTGDVTINTSGLNSSSAVPNFSTHQNSTVGVSFSKKFKSPEDPSFEQKR